MAGIDAHDPTVVFLWAQVLLAWAVAAYLPSNDPAGHQELEAARELRTLARWKLQVWARAFAAGVVVGLLPGASTTAPAARVALVILVSVATVLLPHVRVRLAERRSGRRPPTRGVPALRVQRGIWLAEWEIGLNAFVALASWLLVTQSGLTLVSWIEIPFATDRLASIAGYVALALFTTRGGSFVVRGVLNKVGALPGPIPKATEEQQIDLVEFSRGRIIGVLERLIVLVLMAVQAYQAIAFLMAAKGLIRSKDLESRDFAEYFLIGTLASMALALLTGVAAQLFLEAGR
ncbi:MAG TPA: hypothetical protein VLK84_20665 [Longimicrobium sp.]|nr:hypothetical protein [Longimicrobium sp.]